MKSTVYLVLFILSTSLKLAVSAETDVDYEDGVYKEAVQFLDECGTKELAVCFKEKALKYIERLPSILDIGSGMVIKPTEDAKRTSRQYSPVVLPDEPRAREEALDAVLFERISDYLSSHTLEFKMPPETVTELKRSMEEGRKKKKGGGGMKNMMMLFQMKAAVIGALALKLIGLVAFKALLVAKVALTIASILALKKLLENKHHTSTYEVVSHPHYEDHGHYDRSFNQDLAYRGHLEH